jgi:hypothetical protein
MPGYNPQTRGTAPHPSKNFVLFYTLFVLCRSVYCLCVNVYCTTFSGWPPNCSSVHILIPINQQSFTRWRRALWAADTAVQFPTEIFH